MIVKTQAIVLRQTPTANTSLIVTWLTMDRGRVSTMIKGAYRPKSLFLGQCDLFYTCELLYYHRDTRDLFIAKECAPIKLRPAFRHDWRACATASYLTDLVTRLSPRHAPQSFLYTWLDHALDALAQDGVTESFLCWLELRLMAQLGLAPLLSRCAGCRRPLSAERTVFFSNTRGGMLCPDCARTDTEPAHRLSPDVSAILQKLQAVDDDRAARRFRCTPRQRTALAALLGPFLRFHLDLPLPSRDIALSVMARDPRQRSA